MIIELNLILTLSLSAFAVFVGRKMLRSIGLLNRLNLPEAVVGGVVFSAVLSALSALSNVSFSFDLKLQEPMMAAFFATVGFGASLAMIKRGGRFVVLCFVLVAVAILLQNLIAIGVGTLLGVPPAKALLAGSMTMAGGPGTALAFATKVSELGVDAARELGLAIAMLGIVLGGTLGTPVSASLLQRHNLQAGTDLNDQKWDDSSASGWLDPRFFEHIIVLLMVMGCGEVVTRLINLSGLTFPGYIGAMIVAALLRNLNDRYQVVRINDSSFAAVGSIALSLFIAMSLMTLNLSTFSTLFGPLLLIVAVQAVLVVLLARWIFTRLMGLSYDTAVMAGGFVGFLLGTTANAMANMEAVIERNGRAPIATVVLPIVGAGFVDFYNAILISLCLAVFG